MKRKRRKLKNRSGGKLNVALDGGRVIEVPAVRIRQNGVTRPIAAYMTTGKERIGAAVWKLADELAAQHKRIPTRQEMLAAAGRYNESDPENPITYAILQNHFYTWRKFNGVHGRVKKDGTLARVTGGPRKPTSGFEVPSLGARAVLPPPPEKVVGRTADPVPLEKGVVLEGDPFPTATAHSLRNPNGLANLNRKGGKPGRKCKPKPKPKHVPAQFELPFPIPTLKAP